MNAFDDISKKYGRRRGKTSKPKGTRVAFIGLLLCALMLSVVYLLRVLVGVRSIDFAYFSGLALPLDAVLLLLAAASIGVVCLNAIMVVHAASSQSLFSLVQQRGLTVTGVMLVACALLEAVAAIGFLPDPIVIESAALSGMTGSFGSINIEFLLIFTAFVSFYLSYIFKYGSFLQCFYDETV